MSSDNRFEHFMYFFPDSAVVTLLMDKATVIVLLIFQK